MLEVKHVCYGIDGVPILKDISLGVQKGCIVTIVGPNGCGKSTLLKIISRILRPQSGEVLLDGCDVRTANTRSLARRMAILPQRKNVAVDLTVEQLVQYGRYPHTGFGGKLTKRDIDKVDEAMHAAGIETLRNRAIGTLSGGESQMAWIAMCLAQVPEIILLDEPTTYLDICYQLEVLELVRHLNRAYAMTIVMVLHDINQAAQYSDIVYMMKDGEIYNTGAPKDIFLPESFTDVFRVEMRTLTDRNNEYYVPQRMVRRREENV